MIRCLITALLVSVSYVVSADAGSCRRSCGDCCQPACCVPVPTCCQPICFAATENQLFSVQTYGIQPAYYTQIMNQPNRYIQATAQSDLAIVYELPEAPKPIPKMALYRGKPITSYQAMMLGLPTLPQF